MTQKSVRIGLTAFVLFSAFGGLLWYSLQQDTAYYKHVEEVMNSPQQWEGKALQLHGYVVPGSIFRARSDSFDWKFKVQSKGSMVDATYHGIMPDTLKQGIRYVEITDLTRQGLDKPEYVAADGLHPSGVMYSLWVERILKSLGL